MKQRQRDRDAAIRAMTRLGIAPGDQARLLRLGATLHRLAEAECNGDWPCDNGERWVAQCGTKATRCPSEVCVNNRVLCVRDHRTHVEPGCEALYVPRTLRKSRGYLCPSCCAEADARALAARYGLRAVINGDPRGMVLGLVAGDASAADVDSGRVHPEYVR